MRTFLYEMHNQPFPRWFAGIFIWILPFTEIVIVLLLLFNRTRLNGLRLAFSLMLLFTIYTTLILSGVFHRLPCSCGGVIKYLTWGQHFIFNLFFTAICLTGMIFQREMVAK